MDLLTKQKIQPLVFRIAHFLEAEEGVHVIRIVPRDYKAAYIYGFIVALALWESP